MQSAALLDLDGLLIDSEPLWQEAEVVLFGSLGVPITFERCLETYGMRSDMVVRYWFERYPWQGRSLADVERALVQAVIDLIRLRGEPKRGVTELLSLFKQRQWAIAIVSSSSQEIIQTVVSRFKIEKSIDLICSAKDEEHGKPHPAVYLRAIEKLAIPAERCLAFEDSPTGVQAAVAAGLYCICVPDAETDPKRFSVQPQLFLPTLLDFTPELLTQLRK